MKEVVTLQLGGFSNYVGAHFWNAQNELHQRLEVPPGSASERFYKYHVGGSSEPRPELDPAVLWRESGMGLVPRSVVVDMPLSFSPSPSSTSHAASQAAAQQSLRTANATWDGRATTHVTPGPSNPTAFARDNPFLSEGAEPADVKRIKTTWGRRSFVGQLDNGIHGWADFATVQHHDRSRVSFPTGAGEGTPWARWSSGQLTLEDHPRLMEDVAEAVRWQSEACESLQGFQLLFDINTGSSSLASGIVTGLRDEGFDNSPFLAFGMAGPESNTLPELMAQPVFSWPAAECSSRMASASSLATAAIAAGTLTAGAWLTLGQDGPAGLIPVASSTRARGQSWYQASAEVAMALDSATTPVRSGEATLRTMLNHLAPVPSAHRIHGLELTAPLGMAAVPMTRFGDAVGGLDPRACALSAWDGNKPPLGRALSNWNRGSSTFAELVSIRGGFPAGLTTSALADIQRATEGWIREKTPGWTGTRHVSCAMTPFAVPPTFPELFKGTELGRHGLTGADDGEQAVVEDLALMSRVTTDSGAGVALRELGDRLARIPLADLVHVVGPSTILGANDRSGIENLRATLLTAAEVYLDPNGVGENARAGDESSDEDE